MIFIQNRFNHWKHLNLILSNEQSLMVTRSLIRLLAILIKSLSLFNSVLIASSAGALTNDSLSFTRFIRLPILLATCEISKSKIIFLTMFRILLARLIIFFLQALMDSKRIEPGFEVVLNLDSGVLVVPIVDLVDGRIV